jgi:hypothetical protein
MIMGSVVAALAAHVMLPLSVLSASPGSFPELRAAAPPEVAASPCDLVTLGEVALVLGGTPSGPFPMPEWIDEESGARMSGCGFERGELGISILIAAFDSRAAVERAMEILAEGTTRTARSDSCPREDRASAPSGAPARTVRSGWRCRDSAFSP